MLLLPARLYKAVGVAGSYLLREAPGICFGEGLVLWVQSLVLYSTDAVRGGSLPSVGLKALLMSPGDSWS